MPFAHVEVEIKFNKPVLSEWPLLVHEVTKLLAKYKES